MSNRPEKVAMQREVRERIADSEYVILTDCRGLSVQGMSDLRRKLGEGGSRLMVVRNTFLNLAAKDIGWDDAEGMLQGPTAIVTGKGDVSQAAKALREFVKTANLPLVRGGRFGDRTLAASDVEALATLPSREVLLAHVVGTIAAPMSQLVGVLQQKVASLLYVLKAVADKKSENV